jgi:ATP-binding cassette subfamily B protein
MLLLAIVLLFAQANFDLALPDYLSRIVNVGIQQGGVEDAVPVAVRESTMDKLLLFVEPDDRDAVLDAYTLVDRDAPAYDTAVQDYPVLEEEPVYVLNDDVDQVRVDRLNPVMARAFLVVSGIEQFMEDPSAAAEMGTELPFDPSMLPPGMDVFALLERLPDAQRQQMLDAVNERFGVMG